MRKKRKGSQKGSAFEREICKRLSLWFTDGDRDDIFWRTAGSGARATRRGKKTTFGQYGDIQATDPIGQPLIDAFTIEVKKGYNKLSIQDLIDVIPKKDRKHPLEKIIEKVEFDCRRAKSKSWMLIWKRDRRKCLVILPYVKATSHVVKLLYRCYYESTAMITSAKREQRYYIIPLDVLTDIDSDTFMSEVR
jgi:hypothetical protein